MKVQYDLEGGALEQKKPPCCSKFLLAGLLLVVFVVGSAAGFILYHEFYEWKQVEERAKAATEVVQHIESDVITSSGTGSTTIESFVEEESVATLLRANAFVVTLDENGLSVTVRKRDGSERSITGASSNSLKEVANLVLLEALNAIHGEADKSDAKVVLPKGATELEEIWGWDSHSHDGFRIQFQDGEWSYTSLNSVENNELSVETTGPQLLEENSGILKMESTEQSGFDSSLEVLHSDEVSESSKDIGKGAEVAVPLGANHVSSDAMTSSSRESTETFINKKDKNMEKDVASFTATVDENGLSVTVNKNDGSELFITDGSSDDSKELANMLLAEALNILKTTPPIMFSKLPTKFEDSWRWGYRSHDAYQIQFQDGEWSYIILNPVENDPSGSKYWKLVINPYEVSESFEGTESYENELSEGFEYIGKDAVVAAALLEANHIGLDAIISFSRELTSTETFMKEKRKDVASYTATVNENGLSVTVHQRDGSKQSITGASSDDLKEFANMLLAEALNMVKTSDMKSMFPKLTTKFEDIWRWDYRSPDWYQIEYQNGKWSYTNLNPVENEPSVSNSSLLVLNSDEVSASSKGTESHENEVLHSDEVSKSSEDIDSQENEVVVGSDATDEIVDGESFMKEKEHLFSTVRSVEVTFDKNVLSFSVHQYDGTELFITDASSSALKTFVNDILLEAFKAIKNEADRSGEKRTPIPIPSPDGSEEIWGLIFPTHNGYQIRFPDKWNSVENKELSVESRDPQSFEENSGISKMEPSEPSVFDSSLEILHSDEVSVSPKNLEPQENEVLHSDEVSENSIDIDSLETEVNIDSRSREYQEKDAEVAVPRGTSHVGSDAMTLSSRESTSAESFMKEKEKDDFLSNVSTFTATFDEHGLSVTVHQHDGSELSITDASSDSLKELANMVLVEALTAIDKSGEKVVLPKDSTELEEIWSWVVPSHNGFRVQLQDGQWSYTGRNSVENEESSVESRDPQSFEENSGISKMESSEPSVFDSSLEVLHSDEVSVSSQDMDPQKSEVLHSDEVSASSRDMEPQENEVLRSDGVSASSKDIESQEVEVLHSDKVSASSKDIEPQENEVLHSDEVLASSKAIESQEDAILHSDEVFESYKDIESQENEVYSEFDAQKMSEKDKEAVVLLGANHVDSDAITSTSRESTSSESSMKNKESDEILSNVDTFTATFDENGLSVNVRQHDGTELSITDGSSDSLKEFATMVLSEALSTIQSDADKSGEKVAIPSAESSDELWSWVVPSHDGFRVQFKDGQWSLNGLNSAESEETSVGSTNQQSFVENRGILETNSNEEGGSDSSQVAIHFSDEIPSSSEHKVNSDVFLIFPIFPHSAFMLLDPKITTEIKITKHGLSLQLGDGDRGNEYTYVTLNDEDSFLLRLIINELFKSTSGLKVDLSDVFLPMNVSKIRRWSLGDHIEVKFRLEDNQWKFESKVEGVLGSLRILLAPLSGDGAQTSYEEAISSEETASIDI